VGGLFTSTRNVIKRFYTINSLREHLNVKNERRKKKRKNSAKTGIEIATFWLKSRALYQCSYRDADAYTSRYHAYIAIFITKVDISTTDRCTIFRHNNKHTDR
jgi:hypothetical protein